ncbi:hypothetical protein, partial [Nostoc sp.]|uniref:hypothetical protein n=1 Tax=Nostoc sp. TaxID=1180 RepID=UPI002FF8AA30
MTDEQVLGAAASLAMLSPMANNDVERHAEVPSVGGSGVGTPFRVYQSPTAGNPPTALDSPQRAASFLRRQSLMGETTPDASSRRSRRQVLQVGGAAQ